MEITTNYILSQIFTILMYIFLAISYYSKNRKMILILSIISIITNIVAFVFLNAWTGVAMCVVALVRNLIFMIDEKKNGKSEKITKKDIIILIILYVITVISTIYTYDGFLSLLSVIATSVYTFSIWQKRTGVYKAMGIPTGILWILYNIYIKSVFGFILESILLICSTTGLIVEIKKNGRKQ